MLRKEGESLFIRCWDGVFKRVEPDIIEKMQVLIGNEESQKPHEILKGFIQPVITSTGIGVSIESTWFSLLEECYKTFDNLSKGAFNYVLLTDLFNLLLLKEQINDIWLKVKNLLIENIDQFSTWEYLNKKANDDVKRLDDGTYIDRVRILGVNSK